MKKLIFCPLIAFLLIGVADTLAIAPSPNHYVEMGLKSSQMFTWLDKFPAARVAQAGTEIDEKTALNLVWKLPQVKRKAKEIEQLSRGTIKVGAIVDSSPTPNEPYYTVQVFEKHPDENVTIYWFRVLSPSGTIEVLDLVQNQYISLDKWRSN
jgi:hypothetical protein